MQNDENELSNDNKIIKSLTFDDLPPWLRPNSTNPPSQASTEIESESTTNTGNQPEKTSG